MQQSASHIPIASVGRGGTTGDAALPYVSVVIPCFNEEQFIGDLIERLVPQYDNERFEIIVVDGRSTDRTREVVAASARRLPATHVVLIDNPARRIPVALNLGVRSARGEIIVRMDAHSIPSANYVRRCEELLRDETVSVVGMPWRIRERVATPTARAIALAVAHPFGIGDAKYRLSHNGAPEFVDTVPFGAFRKKVWQELGGYNEALLANEDYDFNYRVRQHGGRVLLDKEAHSIYFARATLADLAQQYFRYGLWKAQMVKLHARSIRWRQVIAPAFLASLVTLALLARWQRLAIWGLLAVVASYWLLGLLSAWQIVWRERRFKLMPKVLCAFCVIHVSWGVGFWFGLFRFALRAAASQSQRGGETA
jgi:succinoglycan biosynthesis protein ExoA